MLIKHVKFVLIGVLATLSDLLINTQRILAFITVARVNRTKLVPSHSSALLGRGLIVGLSHTCTIVRKILRCVRFRKVAFNQNRHNHAIYELFQFRRQGRFRLALASIELDYFGHSFFL
jgi:hypothetical protein